MMNHVSYGLFLEKVDYVSALNFTVVKPVLVVLSWGRESWLNNNSRN